MLVQLGCRLIKDEDIIAQRKCCSKGYALFLPSREMVRRPVLKFLKVRCPHDPGKPVLDDFWRKPPVFECREDLLFNGREDHLGFRIIKDDPDIPGKVREAPVIGDIFPIYDNRAFLLSSIIMVQDPGCCKAERGLPGPRRAGNHNAPAFR